MLKVTLWPACDVTEAGCVVMLIPSAIVIVAVSLTAVLPLLSVTTQRTFQPFQLADAVFVIVAPVAFAKLVQVVEDFP